MGFSFVFKAFAIIIIGGLGNVSGAAVAAVALGMLESVIGGFLPLVMVDALAFVSMIAMLLLAAAGPVRTRRPRMMPGWLRALLAAARGGRTLRGSPDDGQRVRAGPRRQLRHVQRAVRRAQPGLWLHGAAVLRPGRLLRHRRLHRGPARDRARLAAVRPARRAAVCSPPSSVSSSATRRCGSRATPSPSSA